MTTTRSKALNNKRRVMAYGSCWMFTLARTRVSARLTLAGRQQGKVLVFKSWADLIANVYAPPYVHVFIDIPAAHSVEYGVE